MWQEMTKGGDEYIRQVPLLISLFDAHNRAAQKALEQDQEP